MTHTAIIEYIPLSIHLHEVKMNDYLQRKFYQMVSTLKKQSSDIVKVDLWVEAFGSEAKNPRKITATVRFPDISLSASDSGKQWKFIIKQVQIRLARQIEKRAFLLKRPSGRSTAEILANIASP
jgi:hypothetical protein